MSATPKPYAPPTLSRMQGHTAVEVLAASHALCSLIEERKQRGFTPLERLPICDRELCNATLEYIRLVCGLLDTLHATAPATEPPPADPTLMTCTVCQGSGLDRDDPRVCDACHGQGCT